MPFIIFGTRGVTSTLEGGDFYCPQCDSTQDYSLKKVSPWFTIYFIPIFPVGGGERFVECQACGGTFQEGVLEIEPPNPAQQFLRDVYQRLCDGANLGAMQIKLEENGLSAGDAEDLLLKMCEGTPKTCHCGQRYHPEVRRCKSCGEKL